MIRFLADENFHGAIVEGLRRRVPTIDIVRVQDIEIASSDDPVLLAWAALHERIVLTHDIRTLLPDAYQRLREGELLSGVFAVMQDASLGRVIEDLALITECSTADEWLGQVVSLPLE